MRRRLAVLLGLVALVMALVPSLAMAAKPVLERTATASYARSSAAIQALRQPSSDAGNASTLSALTKPGFKPARAGMFAANPALATVFGLPKYAEYFWCGNYLIVDGWVENDSGLPVAYAQVGVTVEGLGGEPIDSGTTTVDQHVIEVAAPGDPADYATFHAVFSLPDFADQDLNVFVDSWGDDSAAPATDYLDNPKWTVVDDNGLRVYSVKFTNAAPYSVSGPVLGGMEFDVDDIFLDSLWGYQDVTVAPGQTWACQTVGYNPGWTAAEVPDVGVWAQTVRTPVITPTAGTNGAISPGVKQKLPWGGSQTFKFTPAAGYRILSVRVNGINVGAPTSYTFKNTQADHTISVSFVSLTSVGTVTRVAGAARFDVAAGLARKGWDPTGAKAWAGVKHVIVANGENGKEADPLAAAGLAGAYNAPVLLTGTASVPAATKTVIAEIAKKNPGVKVHIIGGTGSVPDARWNEIKAIAGVSTTKDRIAGADRYAVTAAIANRIVAVKGANAIKGVILVAGDNLAAFYDALAASPIAYAQTMPMLAVKKGSVPPSVAAVLNSAALKTKPRYAASSATYIGAGALSGATRLTTSSSRYTAASQISSNAIAKGWTMATHAGLTAKLPDALTGGTYLGKQGGVMLFTDSSAIIQSASRTFVTARKTQILNGWVIGGVASVPAAQETGFRNLLK